MGTISTTADHLLKVEYVAEGLFKDVVRADSSARWFLIKGLRGLKVEHADLSLFAERAVDTLDLLRTLVFDVEEGLSLAEGRYRHVTRVEGYVLNLSQIYLPDYGSRFQASGARIDNKHAPTGKSSLRNDRLQKGLNRGLVD